MLKVRITSTEKDIFENYPEVKKGDKIVLINKNTLSPFFSLEYH